MRHFTRLLFAVLFTALAGVARADDVPAIRSVVSNYCITCHDAETKKGGIDFSAILDDAIPRHSQTWEKAVRQISVRQMPPAGKKRPDDATYAAVLGQLETELDRAAAEHPKPGRTDTLRRLTRTEYQNAIRDLLALDIDAAALLPADESSHGFDNVTVGTLSPTLLDRYVSA